jgi:hypothetical protein
VKAGIQGLCIPLWPVHICPVWIDRLESLDQRNEEVVGLRPHEARGARRTVPRAPHFSAANVAEQMPLLFCLHAFRRRHDIDAPRRLPRQAASELRMQTVSGESLPILFIWIRGRFDVP